jgi:hypothetical protein
VTFPRSRATKPEGYASRVLQEEFRGAFVVPTEPLLPYPRLGFEQRAKLTGGEVAQVEQLELGRDGHLKLYLRSSGRKASVEST